MTETHTINRTYYHDFGYSGQEPDYESMAAFLLDEGIVHLSQMWDADNNEGVYLRILTIKQKPTADEAVILF